MSCDFLVSAHAPMYPPATHAWTTTSKKLSARVIRTWADYCLTISLVGGVCGGRPRLPELSLSD